MTERRPHRLQSTSRFDVNPHTESDISEGLEIGSQFSNLASRPERTLPLPSPAGSGPPGFPSLPPLPVVWGPDRPHHVPQSLQSPLSASQRTHIFYDVKHETSGFVSMTSSFPASGSDSDQAMEGMVSTMADLSAEELQRLKTKMVNLQGQVDDFRQQLAMVQQHAAAKDAQYAQIIEQSTRREVQTLAESRKWRSDRERWREERRSLEDTIAHLTSDLDELRGYVGGESTESRGSIESRATLVAELPAGTLHSVQDQSSLHSQATSKREQLESIKYESKHIIDHGTRLVEAGKRIQNQLDELQGRIS